MVILAPVPVEVVPPGVIVKVQVPVDGKLLRTTLPVGIEHEGCVITPGTGAEGLEFTVAVTEDLDPVVQPFAVASTK
jgi:hypothetical protein